MQLSDFDFPFDPSLIAAEPIIPRDRARLLTLNRNTQQLTHRHVADLPNLLRPGDLLVVNDTRVLAARVPGIKRPTGKPVEVLFVRDLGEERWEIMVKGTFRVGQVIGFDQHSRARIVKRDATGTEVIVESPEPITRLFETHGMMPLPPYIKRAPTEKDHHWYQTVFAKQGGAIAAPTAGLHFTEELFGRLNASRITVATITLHVGPGTFKPVTTERIEDHQMGAERFTISEEAAKAIQETKRAGGRVVAVGTTVVRTLETVALEKGEIVPMSGESRLFMTPGFQFKVVDALMTNFHLPRTTLLMLVSAFAGIEPIRRAYEEAVKERYRFYSYGDAMLIL
ncbi:MAG: tRNA preQ1(34) S-adenosylmethionine ribosyltransferase-isomerase QueA [Nitrospira sp.]|nr:tRNA preQ1(34) S-adenosylmethionine ribosyltransferase-isomerase QueA [Nitrospira sp.]MDH4369588.1 tRNA preQ1(34) S-adenosylmethionine ribosyltransferase-isomerase QueA [Nitrospira sp.]MDH5347632.1 tRNA preQ1(34) S-adenosylmethionine ribosyltransferase-isomerase QueA [Nitrospira sp.]MDH5496523.1 tRNA preQ1(34) S-adenosylmethionine ribosyltransferase-isomerase QueA [Nitrospira sp.]MDH5726502.1 tRNA preQ1(34) S-adenosylmethionine ribosyltransferase-isomerase QueA [Nitrospira sp.]